MEQNITRYVDMDGALARMRGNKVLYKKMLQLFLSSAEFATLDQRLNDKDIPHAAEAAHGIKGMTGNLSLPLLFELSTQLMNELREGDANEETIAAYRDAYKETRGYVEELIAQL